MKEVILKTSDKEQEKWYGNMVLHMKVNSNKIKDMAMVFINLGTVTVTLEIGNMTGSMVMVFIAVLMVLCLKVNGNMTNKQEQQLEITQMVIFIKPFGLEIDCCTQ